MCVRVFVRVLLTDNKIDENIYIRSSPRLKFTSALKTPSAANGRAADVGGEERERWRRGERERVNAAGAAFYNA